MDLFSIAISIITTLIIVVIINLKRNKLSIGEKLIVDKLLQIHSAGIAIKIIRKINQSGLSPKEFAKKIGITTQDLINYTSDSYNFDLKEISKLEELLDKEPLIEVTKVVKIPEARYLIKVDDQTFLCERGGVGPGKLMITNENIVKSEKPKFKIQHCTDIENGWVYGDVDGDDVGHTQENIFSVLRLAEEKDFLEVNNVISKEFL